MWRFIVLLPSGEIEHIMIGGRDLAHAFEQFKREWWRPEMTAAIGVWNNWALTARVLPHYDEDTGEMTPVLEELKP